MQFNFCIVLTEYREENMVRKVVYIKDDLANRLAISSKYRKCLNEKKTKESVISREEIL